MIVFIMLGCLAATFWKYGKSQYLVFTRVILLVGRILINLVNLGQTQSPIKKVRSDKKTVRSLEINFSVELMFDKLQQRSRLE